MIDEFRAHSGRVGGPFAGGDLLLLTTVGARSGLEQTSPLAYVRDGDRLLVVGSAGGSPRHPAWYHNLLAHPMARVELGGETFGAIGVPAEGAERDRLFALIVERAPGFADYQAKVDRALPVVILERAHTESGEARTLGAKLVEIHGWLRGQLARVRAEADTYFADRDDGASPAALGLRIRQHCLAFCESLRFHHEGEDAVMLPDLERAHPQLREVIGRLRDEHRTVARIRGELEGLLAGVGTADPERFRTELDRMSRELEAHLDYEEEELIPVLDAVPFPPAAG
ncbi:nitroreductase/quinone reductase family protein [Amycolatopsis cynarae]|uniref:Nitroreductase/quinone reductase family protein n=1 Tax=Amycolatopsis cynarae TaxID=2995223 RepID=A0ABY7AWB4_9PSEU|nr:nitroreductase/quinone reductase family protein [Amycolatopsis sp. HUAS 11-8]WAL63217.1 nitroreductase/quinone reductase family protein [Amycolatopsis sp. HUAS 11-8]